MLIVKIFLAKALKKKLSLHKIMHMRFVLLALTLLLLGCSQKTAKENLKITPSFCYWETSFDPLIDFIKQDTSSYNYKENKEIVGLFAKHFYVRYFDVDWHQESGQALPVSSLDSYRPLNAVDSISFTPSIFITNAVFKKIEEKEMKILAQNILDRIEMINSKTGIMANEILIDCDWTISTKDKYFSFLNHLKKVNPKVSISSTIRLWQYKNYKEAGLPPTNRGLLMCYNIHNPSNYKAENSIATYEEIKTYISHNEYPLKLDIALPIFSWNVVFRNGEATHIDNNFSKKDMEQDSENFEKLSENKFMIKSPFTAHSKYYRYGDEIKIEQISENDLGNMIAHIQSIIEINKQTRISFFSFDKKFINNYGVESINNLYGNF